MPASASGDWRLVDLLIVPDMITTFCTYKDLQYHSELGTAIFITFSIFIANAMINSLKAFGNRDITIAIYLQLDHS